jgi:hypothetical protein
MYSGNGFLAVAAREAAAKATAEAQIVANIAADKAKLEIEKAKRETAEIKTVAVMQGWHGGVSSSLIAAMAGLKPNKVTQLIETFEKVKAQRAAKATVSKAELKQLSGLSETELKVLLTLLEKH